MTEAIKDLPALAPAERAALQEQVKTLRDALGQLLDDMGEHSLCVCPAAKQQAVEALAATENKEKAE